jgi:spermidine synthase
VSESSPPTSLSADWPPLIPALAAADPNLRQRAAVIALYGASGLASVAYEVLWARMLALEFGISIFGVVVTVAAFMAGLGAGSLAALRWLRPRGRPLRQLAVLEGAIGLYALAMPLILQWAGPAIQGAAADVTLYGWYALIAAGACCVLLLPALAMGAGFPLLIDALGAKDRALAHAYGVNTLGAALGALLPLWLLPALGWTAAVRAVAALSLLAAVLFYRLSTQRSDKAPAAAAVGPVNFPGWRALLAYAAVGGASLSLEIAWTRLFGVVMLRTEYVLALILASFLLGVGSGSLLAPRRRQQVWLIVLPLAAAASGLLSLLLLPVLSAWLEGASFPSLAAALSVQGLALVAITLPATLALGAWLPLLDARHDGAGVLLYGANSLGAAAGAALCGLVLIPAVGSAVTVAVAALMLLVAGLTWVSHRAAWFAVPVFLFAAAPLAQFPQISRLMPRAQAGSHDISRYEDAVAMTHVVAQADGQRLLLTDLQRMDASTDPTAVFVQGNQGRLPLLLQGQPRSVLFLGLGTGISVSGSLPFPQLRRTAVELSQGAIDAAGQWFANSNGDALKQTEVVRDDARHFLVATPTRYDVIIGDVFHPDIAGLSALLSVQQFQRARDRLSDDGIFVQWLALNQFDAGSLRVILRSFRSVFPDAQLYLDGMHLAMVGPRSHLDAADAVARNLGRLSDAARDAATAGEGGWTWLGRYFGPIAASTGRLQDEWSPVIEFSLPRARYDHAADLAETLQMLLDSRPALAAAEAQLGVAATDKEAFERGYAASELLLRSWLATMRGKPDEADRLIGIAHHANPRDRWVDYALADRMLASMPQARAAGIGEEEALRRILAVNPYAVEAVRAQWHLYRSRDDQAGAAAARARLLQLSPLDREASAAKE